ncbi:hypothetical protein DB347_03895 [Opitutaceae bacterium EW11]|nr:hypothetical protein DB347_03895 [Opitutaceae bacterium EW11]
MRSLLLLGSLALCVGSARAQQAPAKSAAPAPAAPTGTTADSRTLEDTIELSPFVTTTEKDRGYFAANSMAGTRLNTKVEDLAASISIVTKQQLLDTAAVDINDVFLYEGNTEGTYQYTDFQIENSGAAGDIVVDRTGTNPAGANRVRGLGQANLSIGGFEVTGGLPIDTYNVDAVEISRGPNSNLFGLGNAAGTVNLLPGQASMARRSARTKVQADDFGGLRAEGSYQIPIKQDVLGIALYAVNDQLGFKRKPAYERTTRFTGAVTFRPFRKTTIRAWAETYDNRNSRPNSITPRDLVSQWVSAGKPTWDPTTGTLKKADGTTLRSNWGSRESLFVPNGGVDLYSDSFVTRINQFIDQGQVTYYTPGFRPANIASSSSTIPGPISPSIANSQYNYNLVSGWQTDVPKQILWRASGVSDKSLYDYDNVNFAAPNYADTEATTKQITIDQQVFQTAEHSLNVQAAYFSQNVDGWSHNFIGDSGGIAAAMMVDINEKLLDGTPNPYFLRPFMAGAEPQIKRTIDNADTYRFQGAYKWDLSGRSNWLRWIGVQNLVGYAERRERISGTLGYRSYIMPGHTWYTDTLADGSIRTKVGNSYRMTYRYYLGDNVGSNVDYAPMRPASTTGNFNLRWYDGKAQQWVNEDVSVEELFDSNRLKREVRHTLGAIWQGNMLDDRIVPTYGFRRDRVLEYEGPSRTWYDNGYPNTEPLWKFKDPSYEYSKSYNSGDTTTAGIVVKPLKWLNLYYNQSDSFRPAGLAYDVKGGMLPNPEGKGKDYGFAIRLMDGKLQLKFNQYETTEINARTGGSSSTMTSRLQRIDFDIDRSDGRLPDATDRWHLEASAYRWILAAHHVSDRTQLAPDQVEAYRKEAWDKYIVPAGLPWSYRQWFMDGPKRVFADTNTATARGKEIEINYNPDNYLALKATITQQKAYDSGISIANTEWMNERLAFWQAIKIPDNLERYDAVTNTWTKSPVAGKSWWSTWDSDSGTGSDVTPERWFQQNVEANMALINARAGQKKPQTREWHFTTVGSYRLAGLGFENFLKNMTVGGSVRWEDRGAIGYLADTTILNRTGQYYRYDASKPVYDSDHWQADLMTNYRFKFWDNRVNCLVQLNVRNVFENGGLRVVGVNPDGTARDFRILDPRRFIVSATFEF